MFVCTGEESQSLFDIIPESYKTNEKKEQNQSIPQPTEITNTLKHATNASGDSDQNITVADCAQQLAESLPENPRYIFKED